MPVDTTLEKPLPNNLDAERSVLGAILLDNHALNSAIEHLRPEDFFLDQHRRVFTQMIALGEVQQAIDLVTLTEELNRKGDLEASGGAPYLASLADGMPKVSNIEHYARIVKEKAILRNLIHTTHNIQQRAFEGEDGADAILDGAESDIFALAEDRVRAGLLPIKDIVRDNFERLERIFKEGKSITGIPTGYVELDKLTSGLQPSELLILAARPSQGKTVLALNQLTRAPERDERGPQLSDLRESGAIEQDADVVMFIYRPHFFKAGATPEEREETELRIAKQRNGPTDLVKFVFRSRFTRFEEAAPDAFSQFAPDDN